MKINHTPAPWHEHDMEAFTICGPDHISLALADAKSRPAVENWANTRLICIAASAPHDCDIPGCPGRENKRKLELFDEMLKSLEQAPKPARFRHEDAEQDKAAARTFRESYLRWEASKNGLLREAKGEK